MSSQTGFANIVIRLASGAYPSLLFVVALCTTLLAMVGGVLVGRLEIVGEPED